MEHAEFLFGLSLVVVHVIPFGAYFFGVWITIALKLDVSVEPKEVFWKSIPVGCITIGTLLAVAMYDQPIPNSTSTRLAYGYYQDPPRFILFIGTLMFYGTLATQRFHQIRGEIASGHGGVEVDPEADKAANNKTQKTETLAKSRKQRNNRGEGEEGAGGGG